ncbi:MAG: vWA domain-containing protein [Cyanobacteria bacterium P01_F01_bin.143]
MLNLINLKKLPKKRIIATSLLSASLFGLLTTSAPADETTTDTTASASGTVSPSSFNKDTRVAHTVELERTVKLDLEALIEKKEEHTGNYVKPKKLDVLFLADNTGSMGPAIANVKDHAKDLLGKLEAEYNDVEFGVAYYKRDPQEWNNRSYKRKTGETTETIEVTVQDTKTEVIDTIACTRTWKFNKVDPNRSNNPYQYRVRTTDSSGKKLKDQWPWSNDGDLDGKTESCTWDITEKVNVGEPRTETETKKVNVYEQTPRERLSYKLLEPVDGGSTNNAISAINKWKAKDKGDWPEGGFFGLHQAATNGAPTPEYPDNPGDSNNPDYPGADVYSTGYDYFLQETADSYDPADYNEAFDTKWREDADMKLIVMFGDAKSHTKTITQADTIQALQKNGITVVMINVDTITGDESKEDVLGMSVANDGLDGNNQASDIVTATNGKYSSVDNSVLVELLNGPDIDYSDSYCDSLAELDLVCTILGSVGDAAVVPEVITTYSNPKIDIDFRTAALTPVPDLTIEYKCIDELGCTNVGNNEERKFLMKVTGDIPADYDFKTEVFDPNNPTAAVDGAIANNKIRILNID